MKNCAGRMTSLRGIAAVLPATQPSAKARKQLETSGRRQMLQRSMFQFRLQLRVLSSTPDVDVVFCAGYDLLPCPHSVCLVSHS